MEHAKIKIVISDMYDTNVTITHAPFKSAMDKVDTFHVIILLTIGINMFLTCIMNHPANKQTPLYYFMKKIWKLFIGHANHLPDKFCAYKRLVKCFIISN